MVLFLRLSGEYFVAVILIIMGILLLTRQIFNWNIPVFRIFLGLLIIYVGISILTGGFGFKSDTSIVFSNQNIPVMDLGKEYSLIFSKCSVDFSRVPPPNGVQKVKVNTIFSDGIITLNPQIPTIVKVNSAFARAEMPDHTSTSFGNNSFRSKNFRPDSNYIEIEANVVFGKLIINETSENKPITGEIKPGDQSGV